MAPVDQQVEVPMIDKRVGQVIADMEISFNLWTWRALRPSI